MFELLEMSTRKKNIHEKPIAKNKESKSITTRETTDSIRVGLDIKLN